MDGADSNLSQIEALLQEIGGAVDYDARGVGSGSFGDDMLDIITDGIYERSHAQKTPGGATWDKNDPRYAERKGFRPVGILTGEMLSYPELTGTREITPTEAQQRYGRSEETRRKAAHFSAKRPFFGQAPEDEAPLRRAVEDQIRRRLADLQG